MIGRLRTLWAQRMRRDAAQLSLWLVGTLALSAASAGAVGTTFGTQTDRTNLLAAAIANPIVLLFRGLPSGNDEGAFLAFLMVPWLAMLAGLMSVFLAVRHSRAEEETGRAELVASTAAGRILPLAATVLHAAAANALLAVLVSVSLVAQGFDALGSATMGAATGVTGLVFFAVALAAAQVTQTARGANAAAVWLLVATYLVSGIGNALGTPSRNLTRIDSAPLAWFSPFGWAEQTRPFDADDLLALLPGVAVIAVSIGAATVLQRGRDVGTGVLPARRGRLHAPRTLAGPVGLVWHLSRGAIIGWAVGGALAGLLSTRLGAVISDVATTIPSVQAVVQALAANGSPAQGAVVIFFVLVGVLASCAAVQTVGRARQDEAHGTSQLVLTAAVGRMRWVAAFLLVALSAIALTAVAATAGALAGLASLADPDWSLATDVVVSAAGQCLAAAVFAAATALVYVVVPRATLVTAWSLVLAATVVGLFGAVLGLPDAVVNASPFAVAPTVAGDQIDARGTVWLLLAAAAVSALTLVLSRRRELAES